MKLLAPDDYQPEAERLFSSVRAEVLGILPGARIEHVGASSIPGSMSKGDVDVCVIVDPARHAAAVAVLERAGYTVKPGTLRTSALCMLQSANPQVDLALQVVAEGSTFEFFVTFRDALRRDPSLVAAYNQVKLDHQTLTAEAYRAAKAGFIDRVLRAQAPTPLRP